MGFFSNLFGKNDGSLEVGPKSKYKTISDAIAAAQEGSIIKVKPGTYHEHFTIDKKVTIEGIVDDNGNTPIVWEDTSKENFVISIEANCTISNIEVRGAEKEFASDYTFGTRPKEANICDWWPKCIYAKSSCFLKNLKVCNSASHGITIHENCENPIIESCKCYANARMGILVRNKSESKIILSEIHSNHISGLSFNGSTKNTIESCDIHSNKESGIICVENSEVSISKCKIHDNKYYSVGVEKQCQIALENSEIYKNGRPIYINEGSFGTIQNCKIEYCAGVGEINIGVSEVHIENCTITTSFGKKGIFICSKKQCSVKHCKIDCDIDKMLSDMYKTSILEDISYGFLGLEKCNSLEEYLQIVAKLKAEKEAEKQIQEEEAKKRRQEEEERKRKEKEEADRKEQERLKNFHYETFTDPRDGNTYGTVKIGNQIWMADSLRYKTPNCECHGSGNLYSWAEVMGLPEKYNSQRISESTKEKTMEGNFQGIAPEGWHIPNRVELQQLIDYCEEHSNNTIDVSLLSTQETLKTKKGLKKGTDEFGFNFKIIKIWIPIACSSEKSQSGTHQLYVEKMETENGAYAGLFTGDKVERYQIRCVKNLSEEEQQNLYKRMVKFEIKEKEEEEEEARQKHEREMERIAENESRVRLRLEKLCKYCGREFVSRNTCPESPTGHCVLR